MWKNACFDTLFCFSTLIIDPPSDIPVPTRALAVFGDARNYVIYTNKSAPHAVPTFLNLAHNILIRHHSGNANVRIDAELTGMLCARFGGRECNDLPFASCRLLLQTQHACVGSGHSLLAQSLLQSNLVMRSARRLLFSSFFRFAAHSSVFPPTLRERGNINAVLGIVTTVIILLCFAFIPSGAAVFVIKERETAFKHLQVLAGMSNSAYWAANYLFDLGCVWSGR
jgi:hypothetical protein